MGSEFNWQPSLFLSRTWNNGVSYKQWYFRYSEMWGVFLILKKGQPAEGFRIHSSSLSRTLLLNKWADFRAPFYTFEKAWI